MPGLLQTEGYARAVISAGHRDAEAEEITRRVQARLGRQALLSRMTAPLTIGVLLNEAVLRRPVGAPEVMVGQLRRLADAALLPNVSIRIVPFRVGLHRGALTGPFVILRFPLNSDGQESEPPVVYVDGFTGALYLEKPSEIHRYHDAYADIAATALDEPDSRTLILDAAKDHGQ